MCFPVTIEGPDIGSDLLNERIKGTGIAAGTFITSISNDTIYLSSNLTSNATQSEYYNWKATATFYDQQVGVVSGNNTCFRNDIVYDELTSETNLFSICKVSGGPGDNEFSTIGETLINNDITLTSDRDITVANGGTLDIDNTSANISAGPLNSTTSLTFQSQAATGGIYVNPNTNIQKTYARPSGMSIGNTNTANTYVGPLSTVAGGALHLNTGNGGANKGFHFRYHWNDTLTTHWHTGEWQYWTYDETFNKTAENLSKIEHLPIVTGKLK